MYQGILIRDFRLLSAQKPASLVLLLESNGRATMYGLNGRDYCPLPCVSDYEFKALNLPDITVKVFGCYGYVCCGGSSSPLVYDEYRMMWTDSAGNPSVGSNFRYFPDEQEILMQNMDMSAIVPVSGRRRLVLNAGGDIDLLSAEDISVIGLNNVEDINLWQRLPHKAVYGINNLLNPSDLSMMVALSANSKLNNSNNAGIFSVNGDVTQCADSFVAITGDSSATNFVTATNSAGISVLGNMVAENSAILSANGFVSGTNSSILSQGSAITALNSVVVRSGSNAATVQDSIYIGNAHMPSILNNANQLVIANKSSLRNETPYTITHTNNANVTNNKSIIVATSGHLDAAVVNGTNSIINSNIRTFNSVTGTNSLIRAVNPEFGGTSVIATNSILDSLGTNFTISANQSIVSGNFKHISSGDNNQTFRVSRSIVSVLDHENNELTNPTFDGCIVIGRENKTRKFYQGILIGNENRLISPTNINFRNNIIVGNKNERKPGSVGDNYAVEDSIVMGVDNSIDGNTNSVIIGINNNTAHNVDQVIIGPRNITGIRRTSLIHPTSQGVIAGAENNIQSSIYSVVLGANNSTVNPQYSPYNQVIVGSLNKYSTVNTSIPTAGENVYLIGRTNTVVDAVSTYVRGNNNDIQDTRDSNIIGSTNNISAPVRNVNLIGSNNNITSALSNATIISSGNSLNTAVIDQTGNSLHVNGTVTSSDNTNTGRLSTKTVQFTKPTGTPATVTGFIQTMKTAQVTEVDGYRTVDPSLFGISTSSTVEDLRSLVSALLLVVKELADNSP